MRDPQTLVPVAGLVALVLTWGRDLPLGVVLLVGAVLVAVVLSAVHHAEVVAHRVGEPFGSLVLAVAVTVIEVGLIVMLMTSTDNASTLARDTVFAAVMITVNGIAGLSLFVGGLRHHLIRFNPEGAGAALTTVGALATLALVVPTFTSAPGPTFSAPQLAFAAVASLALYGIFVSAQTRRHRDFFLPVDATGQAIEEEHARPPSSKAAVASLVLLLVSLVGVVGLAKVASPSIEEAVAAVGLPHSFVGVLIAMLVLAPETLAAVRAARRDRVQTSLNLAYGSAMASIGLTIPTIAIASIWLPGDLALGLDPLHMSLLAISLFAAALTVVPGRATRMQGGVHLVLLAAYVFLAASP